MAGVLGQILVFAVCLSMVVAPVGAQGGVTGVTVLGQVGAACVGAESSYCSLGTRPAVGGSAGVEFNDRVAVESFVLRSSLPESRSGLRIGGRDYEFLEYGRSALAIGGQFLYLLGQTRANTRPHFGGSALWVREAVGTACEPPDCFGISPSLDLRPEFVGWTSQLWLDVGARFTSPNGLTIDASLHAFPVGSPKIPLAATVAVGFSFARSPQTSQSK